jgi:hypothetical protein
MGLDPSQGAQVRLVQGALQSDAKQRVDHDNDAAGSGSASMMRPPSCCQRARAASASARLPGRGAQHRQRWPSWRSARGAGITVTAVIARSAKYQDLRALAWSKSAAGDGRRRGRGLRQPRVDPLGRALPGPLHQCPGRQGRTRLFLEATQFIGAIEQIHGNFGIVKSYGRRGSGMFGLAHAVWPMQFAPCSLALADCSMELGPWGFAHGSGRSSSPAPHPQPAPRFAKKPAGSRI